MIPKSRDEKEMIDLEKVAKYTLKEILENSSFVIEVSCKVWSYLLHKDEKALSIHKSVCLNCKGN